MLLTKSCSLSAFFVRKMRVPWEMSVAAASLCSWPDHIVVQVGLVVQQDVADWMLVAVLQAGFGCQRIGFPRRQDSCTWRWSCPRGGGTGPNPPKSHGLCNIYKQHDMGTSQLHMDSTTSTRWIARIPQEYTWVVRPHRVCDLCPYRNSYRFCDPHSTDTRKELTWVLQPLQTALRSYLKRSRGFCNSKVSRNQGKKENARIPQERQ